ncbi:helix-hairpin-helix domain-containing protein [Geminocystis herdmanii]|uniref:helix-hairpin-helix domain-containing protein n=1 Tax=Geminocystis herdmanii TaxID=669359 RepID=UPI0003459515|nr:helix-hairpin-helix domain-containing protein [Geminocystis herdmanii]
MAYHKDWFNKNPPWLWWSFLPIFGGVSLVYAGWKSKTNSWLFLGGGLTFVCLLFSSLLPSSVYLFWLAQIIIAFQIKQTYLIKTAPKGVLIPSVKIAQLMAEYRGQIDINNCSKDDIVYQLGLSIIHANDIESLRNEGYMFMDIDDLSEVAGIPENILRRIEPLMIFGYDLRKEADVSWRRLNSLTIEELMIYNIREEDAKKIVLERTKKGQFTSLLDVRKRTGIPIQVYRHLA